MGAAALRAAARALLAASLCGAAPACASFGAALRGPSEVWGFAAPWDARSAASIAANASALDAIVTGWIALDSATARPLELFADTLELPPGTRRLALVTSWHLDRFHPAVVRALAASPALLAETASAIGRRARRGGYDGLVVDFEEHAPADLPALLAVVRSIGDSARAHGVARLAIAIPATDTAAYPAEPLLRVADQLVVMLYDEHWSRSDPGPIASPEWARRAIGLRIGEVGASRLIAGLPLYGYRWASDSSAVTIGWHDAQRDAAAAGIAFSREPATYTLRARTPRWETWIADAPLVDSLMTEMEGLGIRRFALWRLGTEDPGVWRILPRR